MVRKSIMKRSVLKALREAKWHYFVVSDSCFSPTGGVLFCVGWWNLGRISDRRRSRLVEGQQFDGAEEHGQKSEKCLLEAEFKLTAWI